MAISNAMSTSLISASSSMKMVRTQQGTKKQMEGKAGVLKAEINLDGGRGGDTKKKEAELEGVQDKATKIENSQMNNISEMNENMKWAAKEDQKEQEAARVAEEKRAEKKKAKKAAEKKQAEKKAQEERLEKLAEKNIRIETDDKTNESDSAGETKVLDGEASMAVSGTVDITSEGITPATPKPDSVGAKVDVQV